MATYSELYDLLDNATMKNKVHVAIAIASDLIKTGGDTISDFDQAAGAHDFRVAWVKNANSFLPTPDLIQTFWNAMLAANEGIAAATILGSNDGSIQTNVNKVVDILANGEVV